MKLNCTIPLLILLGMTHVGCAELSANRQEEAEKSKTGNGLPEAAEVEGESELDDSEDLKVIPPEVVSGAYLVCGMADATSGTPAGLAPMYTCVTMMDEETRFMPIRYFHRWVPDGDEVQAKSAFQRVTRESMDMAWEVPSESVAKSLQPRLEFLDRAPGGDIEPNVVVTITKRTDH